MARNIPSELEDAVGRAALERSLSTLDIWLIVFGVFVAIGVVGESVIGFLHWRRSGQLQTLQTSENLALEKAVADANTRALDAQLALEKFKAPRVLTPEQKLTISERLKAFESTKYDGGIAPGDAEAALLLVAIENVLAGAKWNEINWDGGDVVFTRSGRSTAGLISATNVIVAVFPGQPPQLTEAATALVSALNDQGIAAQLQDATGITNNTRDAVHILIGRKM